MHIPCEARVSNKIRGSSWCNLLLNKPVWTVEVWQNISEVVKEAGLLDSLLVQYILIHFQYIKKWEVR